MKLRVSHLSRYEYAQSVSFSPHALYLRPRETPLLRVSRFKFNISPNAKVSHAVDAFDNAMYWAHFWDSANALNIRTEFEIETLETNPFDFLLRADAARFPFAYNAYERYVLAPYLAQPSPPAAGAIASWLQTHQATRPTETLSLLSELNRALTNAVSYRARAHGAPQDVATTLQTGSGACRDYAVAMVEICRSLGLAARFVSGYVYTATGHVRADENTMHAWAEIYLPGAGWKGVDPCHGIFCADTYIPVAHAPVPECIGPVQGSYYSTVRVPSQLTTNVMVENVTALG